jgi:hypothetical protein
MSFVPQKLQKGSLARMSFRQDEQSLNFLFVAPEKASVKNTTTKTMNAKAAPMIHCCCG